MKHNYLVVVSVTDNRCSHLESYVVSSNKPIVTAWECTRLAQYMQIYICRTNHVVITNMVYLGEEVNSVPEPKIEDPNIKFDSIITFYDAVKLE